MDLNPGKLADHVKDAHAFELPFQVELPLPRVFGLQLTKFMVLEVAVAVLMLLIFVPLARRVVDGKPPKGRFWNMLEVLIFFIRDGIVRPAIGRHDADRFLPFILTLFFFILFCNLLGLLPWLGSPTAAICTTAPLAFITVVVSAGSGMKKFGMIGFWRGLCPPMDLPIALKITLVPMIIALEAIGLLVRHCVLAIRLLANMFGGHFVLALVIGFIPAMAHSLLWYGATPFALGGGVAISMLELIFAFLQAYVFSFLGSLFIGMSIHQH